MMGIARAKPCRTRLLAAVAASLLALLLSACGGENGDTSANEGGSTADSAVTIVMSSASLSNQTAFTAQDFGIFEKNGLDVKLVTTSQAATALQTLLSGDAQFAMGSRDDPITAKLAGEDVVFVANHQAGWRAGIVISKKLVPDPSALSSMSLDDKLKLLDGRTFASTSASSSLTAISTKAFESAGVDVKFTYMEGTVMPTALEQGKIDGFIQTSPLQEQAVQNGSGVILVAGPEIPGSGGPTGLWAPLITSGQYAKDHPDTVDKVLASFFQAARLVKENPDAVKVAAEKRLKLESALFDAAWASNVDGLQSPIDHPLTVNEVQFAIDNDFAPDKVSGIKASDLIIPQDRIDAAVKEAQSVDWIGDLSAS